MCSGIFYICKGKPPKFQTLVLEYLVQCVNGKNVTKIFTNERLSPKVIKQRLNGI